jgi:hypothetical protein
MGNGVGLMQSKPVHGRDITSWAIAVGAKIGG